MKLITLLTALLLLLSCRNSEPKQRMPALGTNEDFVKELYTEIQLDSPKKVFEYIYSHLNDSILVFPSENVYYFKIPILGKTYEGTITFYPEQRDTGMVGFGYVTRLEDKYRQRYYPIRGGSYDFTKKDGMVLTKVDNDHYTMTFKGKTVQVSLYKLADEKPKELVLKNNEEWVTSTFDESGLQFHIIFSQSRKKLFWILNENVFVPESFHSIKESKNVLIGDRTEFAFYNDSINNRKILIGVEGLNVMQNNWYDGPFDHLADNRVHAGKLNMSKYLEAHFPEAKGRIDKYGKYLKSTGGRVALAPYRVYFSTKEFNEIDNLKAALDYDAFCDEITRQIYVIPDDFYK